MQEKIFKLIIICFLTMLAGGLAAQALSPAEQELYKLINAYRKEKKLPAIPLSAALTMVAQTHSNDLAAHRPDEDKACNMHSWSDQGDWTACCYTADHAKATCMWDKPAELTSYPGKGYEIVYQYSSDVIPKEALARWKSSPGHNGVIINAGQWSQEWKAIGIGIKDGYATVWFGHKADEQR